MFTGNLGPNSDPAARTARTNQSVMNQTGMTEWGGEPTTRGSMGTTGGSMGKPGTAQTGQSMSSSSQHGEARHGAPGGGAMGSATGAQQVPVPFDMHNTSRSMAMPSGGDTQASAFYSDGGQDPYMSFQESMHSIVRNWQVDSS